MIVGWVTRSELRAVTSILAVAALLHLIIALLDRVATSSVIARRAMSRSKARTILGLLRSLVVFTIWFVSLGMALNALGVDLKAYIATASIIGIAVGFGFQGLVQDVITGVTLVFADLFDVGEMVEISGQAGLVEHVGIRFTVLRNFMGARVYIPNRLITNVINYPAGYVRAMLDVSLPENPARAEGILKAVERAVAGLVEQFPRVFVAEPSIESRRLEALSSEIIRVRLRVWPGQNALVENAMKNQILRTIRACDEEFADNGLVVSWEVEKARKKMRPERERTDRG